jgi:hypothetical protein
MKNLSSKIALANFILSPSKLISFKFILVQAVSLKSLFSSFYPIARYSITLLSEKDFRLSAFLENSRYGKISHRSSINLKS